jgi:hypothetical protein
MGFKISGGVILVAMWLHVAGDTERTGVGLFDKILLDSRSLSRLVLLPV